MEIDLLNIFEIKADNREIHLDVKLTEKSFVPLVKNNVTYIVSGLIFNDKNELLLMQEAKKSCYGKWYLPAGRMEMNETIEDAVRREVLEETGIICKPVTVSYVEILNTWFRFNMICENIGGQLKKTPDDESLQAEWFSVKSIFDKEVELRHKDILKVIEIACNQIKTANFIPIRPINIPHKQVVMELLIVFYDNKRKEYDFVMSKKPSNHLPTFEMVLFSKSFFKLLSDIFGADFKKSLNFKTILKIEHDGKPSRKNDGLAITALVHLNANQRSKISEGSNFDWVEIENKTINEYVKKYFDGNSVVLKINDL